MKIVCTDFYGSLGNAVGLSRCMGERVAEHPTHPYIWGITPAIPREPLFISVIC